MDKHLAADFAKILVSGSQGHVLNIYCVLLVLLVRVDSGFMRDVKKGLDVALLGFDYPALGKTRVVSERWLLYLLVLSCLPLLH